MPLIYLLFMDYLIVISHDSMPLLTLFLIAIVISNVTKISPLHYLNQCSANKSDCIATAITFMLIKIINMRDITMQQISSNSNFSLERLYYFER